MRWRLVLAATLVALAARPAGAAQQAGWPCIQVKVPELSPGTMWAGPPIDEGLQAWTEDREVAELVRLIAPRRVTVDEATQRIEAFAESLGDDRDRRLTLLFAGLLQTIDAERKDIIRGIERYARRQAALADKIKAETAEQSTLQDKAAPTEAERARILELERQREWDIRIFDERAASLTFVCESPVLLEKRMFALARAIMAYLE